MSIITSIVSCPNIQEQLDNHFLGLNGKVTEPNGMLQYLLSPTNTANVLQRQIDPGNGKKRTVEVTYKQRESIESVSSTAVQNCDGGDERGDLSTTYTIDETSGASRVWSFTPKNIMESCRSNEAWLAEEIASKMDVISRYIQNDIAGTAITNIGEFYNSAATNKNVTTKLSSGEISYELNEIVKYEFEQMGHYESVFAIGNGELIKHARRLDASCCITTKGIDPGVYASQNPVMFIQDRAVADNFATNPDGTQFLAVAPGAIQFISWNEFDGAFNTFDDDTYKQGTLVHPSTGLEFDYLAKFDCGKWNFQLKLAYDLAFLPTDLFEAVDAMHGVNWVNKFTIVNA